MKYNRKNEAIESLLHKKYEQLDKLTGGLKDCYIGCEDYCHCCPDKCISKCTAVPNAGPCNP
jgi:hypothetical protein